MKMDIIPEMVKELEIATRKAVIELKEKHDEKFYYFSLITNGSGSCPYLAAWSYEALERETVSQVDPEKAKYYLKWSYSESPYYAYGEEYFKKVEELLYIKRAFLYDLNDCEYEKEICLRLNSMEKVMFNLDKEGLFGTGTERLDVVINAEMMPPEYPNTERAIRLNPLEAVHVWLNEAAEDVTLLVIKTIVCMITIKREKQ